MLDELTEIDVCNTNNFSLNRIHAGFYWPVQHALFSVQLSTCARAQTCKPHKRYKSLVGTVCATVCPHPFALYILYLYFYFYFAFIYSCLGALLFRSWMGLWMVVCECALVLVCLRALAPR